MVYTIDIYADWEDCFYFVLVCFIKMFVLFCVRFSLHITPLPSSNVYAYNNIGTNLHIFFHHQF